MSRHGLQLFPRLPKSVILRQVIGEVVSSHSFPNFELIRPSSPRPFAPDSYTKCAVCEHALILFSEFSELFASGVVSERGCKGGVCS